MPPSKHDDRRTPGQTPKYIFTFAGFKTLFGKHPDEDATYEYLDVAISRLATILRMYFPSEHHFFAYLARLFQCEHLVSFPVDDYRPPIAGY